MKHAMHKPKASEHKPMPKKEMPMTEKEITEMMKKNHGEKNM